MRSTLLREIDRVDKVYTSACTVSSTSVTAFWHENSSNSIDRPRLAIQPLHLTFHLASSRRATPRRAAISHFVTKSSSRHAKTQRDFILIRV